MVKVNAHGIQGDAARWIRHWLAGRHQWVCINQFFSNWTAVTSGGPQGSVLVPLLLLIKVNNLYTNIVSKMSKFAYDTKLSDTTTCKATITITCSCNQQLPTIDQQRDLESSSRKTSIGKNKQRKAPKRPSEYWCSFPAISGTKIKNWSSHYTNP